jgi:hypothetical protein
MLSKRMTNIKENDLRAAARTRRMRELITDALRARKFSETQTLAMGFGLIDFARKFGKVVNA